MDIVVSVLGFLFVSTLVILGVLIILYVLVEGVGSVFFSDRK